MIAINWFEVSLPTTIFEIYLDEVDGQTSGSKKERSLDHWTMMGSKDNRTVVFHITSTSLAQARLEKIDLEQYPHLAQKAIENGYGIRMRKAKFNVYLGHVGGVGYRPVKNSIRPKIYESLEGIRFHCFYGFGRVKPTRWGLVLSLASSQRFRISLRDAHLREFALGKRVVPMDSAGRAEEDKDSGPIGPRSGTLESVQADQAILVDDEGNRRHVSVDDWTLPCRRDNLLGYIRRVEGAGASSQVATRLQQDALTLTAERRMNTSLAKDQLDKLRKLMDENQLLLFHLPLPGEPFAKLNPQPLILGANQ